MSFVTGVRQQRHILKKIFANLHQSHAFKNGCSTPSVTYLFESNIGANLLLHHRWCHSSTTQFNLSNSNDEQIQSAFYEFHNDWPTETRSEFLRDMILIEDFITETEETALVAEAQKSLKRMRYAYDHWDNAIHGYREMEKTNWSPDNATIFEKVRNKAFVANVLPDVHILDLAADGIIKPHVDSSRYCGSTIAGLSLLTDCIMRLKRVDENQYKQCKQGEEEDNQTRPKPNIQTNTETDYFVDILLKRRSLYIMKDSARYKFSHEVLASKSIFMGNEITKDRRISIICRNQA